MVSERWSRALAFAKKDARRLRVLRVALEWVLKGERSGIRKRRHEQMEGDAPDVKRCIDCRMVYKKSCQCLNRRRSQGLRIELLRQMLSISHRKNKTEGLDIDIEWLAATLLKQEGRCAYSGHIMTFKSFGDWKYSVERIDNLRGYTRDNVVIICYEFQSSDRSIVKGERIAEESSQWTREKFQDVFRLRDAPVPPVTEAPPRSTTQKKKRRVDGENISCNKCDKFKPRCDFGDHPAGSLGKQASCRECCAANKKAWHATLHGNVTKLMQSVNGTVKQYPEKKGNITVEHIRDLYRKQEGRCFYTGVPLSLQKHSNWRMSLERVDPLRGYDRDNTVLCVAECNVPDHTAARKCAAAGGSSAWTRAKAAECWPR